MEEPLRDLGLDGRLILKIGFVVVGSEYGEGWGPVVGCS
jgi:hypothetical protein